MSTKLYNGYKLNNLSVNELKEFMDELRQRLYKVFKSEYADVFNLMTIDIVDNIVACDYLFSKTGDETDIEKYFVSILQRAYQPCRMIDDFYKRKVNVTLDFALKEYLNYDFIGSVKNIVNDIIKQKIFVSNTKNTRIGGIDLQNEIAFFPTQDKIMFLAYGNNLEKVLDDILKSKRKDVREFRQKYGFEYYGYWNNTDRLNGISQKKWDERGDEWNAVLAPDYIPSRHGICSEVISGEQFLDEMEFDYKLNGTLIGPELRAEGTAVTIISKNWFKNQKITNTNAVDAVDQFKKLKESGVFDAEIDELKTDLEKLLPVIDDNLITKKAIDLAPNYKQAKGL